jgi:hypothetical protein
VSVLLLCDSFTCVEEKTISELHDVGLVDTSDFLYNQPRSPLLFVVDNKVDPPFGCS